MDKLKSWGSLVVTALVFVLVFWVLYYVMKNLGTDPTTGQDGTVTKDPFQRSKDILIVVLPLATAAVGYWFGSDGKDKAEDKAAAAQQEVQKERAEKDAVLSVAQPINGVDLLNLAREKHPAAFGLEGT